jgi:DNA gyrase subunit A
VPESARASRGQSVYALLDGADRGDRIVSMIPVGDLEREDRFLVFLTRQGLVKRTPLSEFSNPRSGGVKAAGLKDGDRVLDVALSDGAAEVILLSRGGRAIRFPEEEVSVFGRTAQGVKGIGLRGDDQVVGMLMIRRDATVLMVRGDGYGKRTPVSEFPLQKRGGLGTMAVSGDGAAIVGALEVVDADEVMLISAGGQVKRVAATAVPVQGRRTQGKRVVELKVGDRLVEVTRAEAAEEGPSGGGTKGDGPVPETLGGEAQAGGGSGTRASEREASASPEDQLDLLG